MRASNTLPLNPPSSPRNSAGASRSYVSPVRTARVNTSPHSDMSPRPPPPSSPISGSSVSELATPRRHDGAAAAGGSILPVLASPSQVHVPSIRAPSPNAYKRTVWTTPRSPQEAHALSPTSTSFPGIQMPPQRNALSFDMDSATSYTGEISVRTSADDDAVQLTYMEQLHNTILTLTAELETERARRPPTAAADNGTDASSLAYPAFFGTEHRAQFDSYDVDDYSTPGMHLLADSAPSSSSAPRRVRPSPSPPSSQTSSQHPKRPGAGPGATPTPPSTVNAKTLSKDQVELCTTLGKNAELRMRTKAIERSAERTSTQLEDAHKQMKLIERRMANRDEKLRVLLKEKLHWQQELQDVRDHVVEEKMRQVDLCRRLETAKREHAAQLDALECELRDAADDNAQLRAQVADANAHAAFQSAKLEDVARLARAEKEKLVACIAETRRKFRDWKDTEATTMRSAHDHAMRDVTTAYELQLARHRDEKQKLRDKVRDLEVSLRLVQKDRTLSPLELSLRKAAILHSNDSAHSTNESELIEAHARVRELEELLAHSQANQQRQATVIAASEATISQLVQEREVTALETLSVQPLAGESLSAALAQIDNSHGSGGYRSRAPPSVAVLPVSPRETPKRHPRTDAESAVPPSSPPPTSSPSPRVRSKATAATIQPALNAPLLETQSLYSFDACAAGTRPVSSSFSVVPSASSSFSLMATTSPSRPMRHSVGDASASGKSFAPRRQDTGICAESKRRSDLALPESIHEMIVEPTVSPRVVEESPSLVLEADETPVASPNANEQFLANEVARLQQQLDALRASSAAEIRAVEAASCASTLVDSADDNDDGDIAYDGDDGGAAGRTADARAELLGDEKERVPNKAFDELDEKSANANSVVDSQVDSTVMVAESKQISTDATASDTPSAEPKSDEEQGDIAVSVHGSAIQAPTRGCSEIDLYALALATSCAAPVANSAGPIVFEPQIDSSESATIDSAAIASASDSKTNGEDAVAVGGSSSAIQAPTRGCSEIDLYALALASISAAPVASNTEPLASEPQADSDESALLFFNDGEQCHDDGDMLDRPDDEVMLRDPADPSDSDRVLHASIAIVASTAVSQLIRKGIHHSVVLHLQQCKFVSKQFVFGILRNSVASVAEQSSVHPVDTKMCDALGNMLLLDAVRLECDVAQPVETSSASADCVSLLTDDVTGSRITESSGATSSAMIAPLVGVGLSHNRLDAFNVDIGEDADNSVAHDDARSSVVATDTLEMEQPETLTSDDIGSSIQRSVDDSGQCRDDDKSHTQAEVVELSDPLMPIDETEVSETKTLDRPVKLPDSDRVLHASIAIVASTAVSQLIRKGIHHSVVLHLQQCKFVSKQFVFGILRNSVASVAEQSSVHPVDTKMCDALGNVLLLDTAQSEHNAKPPGATEIGIPVDELLCDAESEEPIASDVACPVGASATSTEPLLDSVLAPTEVSVTACPNTNSITDTTAADPSHSALAIRASAFVASAESAAVTRVAVMRQQAQESEAAHAHASAESKHSDDSFEAATPLTGDVVCDAVAPAEHDVALELNANLSEVDHDERDVRDDAIALASRVPVNAHDEALAAAPETKPSPALPSCSVDDVVAMSLQLSHAATAAALETYVVARAAAAASEQQTPETPVSTTDGDDHAVEINALSIAHDASRLRTPDTPIADDADRFDAVVLASQRLLGDADCDSASDALEHVNDIPDESNSDYVERTVVDPDADAIERDATVHDADIASIEANNDSLCDAASTTTNDSNDTTDEIVASALDTIAALIESATSSIDVDDSIDAAPIARVTALDSVDTEEPMLSAVSDAAVANVEATTATRAINQASGGDVLEPSTGNTVPPKEELPLQVENNMLGACVDVVGADEGTASSPEHSATITDAVSIDVASTSERLDTTCEPFNVYDDVQAALRSVVDVVEQASKAPGSSDSSFDSTPVLQSLVVPPAAAAPQLPLHIQTELLAASNAEIPVVVDAESEMKALAPVKPKRIERRRTSRRIAEHARLATMETHVARMRDPTLEAYDAHHEQSQPFALLDNDILSIDPHAKHMQHDENDRAKASTDESEIRAKRKNFEQDNHRKSIAYRSIPAFNYAPVLIRFQWSDFVIATPIAASASYSLPLTSQRNDDAVDTKATMTTTARNPSSPVQTMRLLVKKGVKLSCGSYVIISAFVRPLEDGNENVRIHIYDAEWVEEFQYDFSEDHLRTYVHTSSGSLDNDAKAFLTRLEFRREEGGIIIRMPDKADRRTSCERTDVDWDAGDSSDVRQHVTGSMIAMTSPGGTDRAGHDRSSPPSPSHRNSRNSQRSSQQLLHDGGSAQSVVASSRSDTQPSNESPPLATTLSTTLPDEQQQLEQAQQVVTSEDMAVETEDTTTAAAAVGDSDHVDST